MQTRIDAARAAADPQRPSAARPGSRNRDGPRRGPRLLHGVLRSLAGLATLGVVATLIAWVVARDLDRPWPKAGVRALVHASAGLDIDYRHLRVAPLSGAEIEGLVVASPPELRAIAPIFVRAGHVDATWSLASLLGRGPRVERLTASEVTLVVAVDERGRTSFDALSRAPSRSEVPLSRRAASLLANAPPIGRIAIDGVALAVIGAEGGRRVRLAELRGGSFAMEAAPTGDRWRVRADVGSRATPVDLALFLGRDGATASVRATFSLAIDATAAAVSAGADLHLLEQTLAASLPGDARLHADATARFDATAGRTEVTLHETITAPAAATVEARIDLTDGGGAVVRTANGEVDLARLLQVLPAGLVPLTAERARVRYRIESLAVRPRVGFSDRGSIELDADVSALRVEAPGGPVDVSAGTLSVRGRPSGAGRVAGLVRVRAHLDGLDRQGATPASARGIDVELGVDGLRLAGGALLGASGDVALSAAVRSLAMRARDERARVDGLTVSARVSLADHAPYAGVIEALAHVRVARADGGLLVDAPARLRARLDGVFPDVARPAQSRGVLRADVDLGELHASLDARKLADGVDFAIEAATPSLSALRPLLGPELAGRVPWGQVALAARSTGHFARLGGGAPEMRQDTRLRLERPAFGSAAARSLALSLRSRGTWREQEFDADLRAQALAFGGGEARDEHVAFSGAIDLDAPSLRARLESEERAAAELTASLSFERRERAVRYAIDGRVTRFAPLARLLSRVPGLAGFDLSALEVDVSSRGVLVGVVSDVTKDGALRLEEAPARTAGVEGTTDLRIAQLRWAGGAATITAPAATLHGEMHVAGGRRTLDLRLEVPSLRVGVGRHQLDFAGITDDTSAAATGDLADPEVELTHRVAVRGVRQDVVPWYPIDDVVWTLSATRDPDGLLGVSDSNLTNGAGGTTLRLSGGADIGARRRRMSLRAELVQDLARLSNASGPFRGRGTLALTASLESPDLSHFRARASLNADDVHARVPSAGVELEAASGTVPITGAFELRDGRLAMRHDRQVNPYSMLRFTDQHPLLRRAGFVSIGSLKTRWASMAPVVGNLEIDQNVVSLRQFEMGVRGGSIAGEGALDWDGPRSTLELHLHASGVRSSYGEPLDGNVALTFAAADRAVEGRGEILRLGRRHVLDLLDAEDPRRVDPAMNRIRSAIAFGYPKRLRLVFHQGFASARLELGGLASLFAVDELRGLPVGPIVDRLLAPALDGEGTR